ncbi:MAG: PKD domain-containing protein [Bacteroidia bacterium]|nr:PKD domain-containing protein [Bacteroidia bacterium]
MRKNLSLTLLLLFVLSGIGAMAQSNSLQALPSANKSHPAYDFHAAVKMLRSRTVSCGQDTLQYALAKATGIPALLLNNATSARSACQYYDAPQPITIHGFTFYGFKQNTIGGVTQTITCQLYAAGPDSMPLGTALATKTIVVDTTSGTTLASIAKHVTFTSPVTVSAPYVLVVDNNTANSLIAFFNDWTAGDGAGEYLASARIGANWLRGYDLSVGGNPFDADFLAEPYVTYSLSANVASSISCFSSPSPTVCFTNTASPVFFHRMYNQLAFLGAPEFSFAWDFGDGSGVQSVVDSCIPYTGCGPVTVTMGDTIFGWGSFCGEDTTFTLSSCLVSGGFTQTATGLQAIFTDTSSGGSSWSWDFGDGSSTSTQQNPSHTFPSGGTYYVCQTVSSACGGNVTVCDSVAIICAAPAASFTSSAVGYDVAFTSTSSGANGWSWDFGDGNTSATQNPNHTYGSAGTYTVCLIVSNICGADTFCQVQTVSCPVPSPNFSASVNLFTASFADMSQSTGTASYLWDFGDGGTSTTASPAHTYAAAGSYTVCLTITDVCGTDSSCKTVTITCPVPTAGFTFTTTNLTANFTNTSSSGVGSTFSWDFGDGNTSTATDPSHTFGANGVYFVCMTVHDTCGTNTICDSVPVVLIGLNNPDFNPEFNLYPNPGSGGVNLEIALNKEEKVQIQVTNLMGQTLESLNLGRTQAVKTRLNLNHLAEGVYLIRLQAGEQQMVRRFILTK